MTSDRHGAATGASQWPRMSPCLSGAEVDRTAQAFVDGLNPKQYVGSRHHIVPRFILANFANDRGQVYVRDLDTRSNGLRNIRDLAVTDFYTFIDLGGELNSSFESLLGEVETAASVALSPHLERSAFVHPRPFSEAERLAIDPLVSMQSVRGNEQRRISEVLTDYYVKTVNQDKISKEDLDSTEFIPHQNDTIKESLDKAETIHRFLAGRACFLVTLDRSLLATCDEPVLVFHAEETGFPGAHRGKPKGMAQQVAEMDVVSRDLILVTGSNIDGIATAEGIAMAVTSNSAVVYAEPGTSRPLGHVELTGREADEFAAYMVERTIENAYTWIAAHPDHATIRTMRLPRRRPPLTIMDGGTSMSRRLAKQERRRAMRLDKNARPVLTE